MRSESTFLDLANVSRVQGGSCSSSKKYRLTTYAHGMALARGNWTIRTVLFAFWGPGASLARLFDIFVFQSRINRKTHSHSCGHAMHHAQRKVLSMSHQFEQLLDNLRLVP